MKMPVKGVHEDTRHGISVGVSARIMNLTYAIHIHKN